MSCLQVADVELKEVQSLLLPHYKVCHEKYGWLAPGTLDKIRKLIDESANETIIQKFGKFIIL
jgi:hypothetical protein